MKTCSQAGAFSFGDFFSTEAIGYSLIRTWSSILFSGSLISIAAAAGVEARMTVHNVSLAFLVITYFALPLVLSIRKPTNGKILNALALATIEVGAACVVVSVFFELTPGVASYVGALLTGFGSAVLTLLWGESFATLTPGKAMLSTLGAFLFASVFVLAFSAVSYPTLCLSALLLPVASYAMLERKRFSLSDVSPSPIREELSKQSTTMLQTPLFVTLVSLVLGSMNQFSSPYLQNLDFNNPEIKFLATLLITLIGVIVFQLRGSFSASALLQASTVIPAVFLLLLPFLHANYAPLGFISSIGITLLRISVWVYLARICAVSGISPLVCFGFGLGAHYLGLGIGEQFTRMLVSSDALDESVRLFAFSIFLLFLLVIAYVVGSKPLSHPEPPSRQKGGGPRRFHTKLEEVAAAHGLTEREAEMLEYLAKGYSSKSIQQTLHISASTVSAHSGSIYRKLGVHSKEEVAVIVRDWDKRDEQEEPLPRVVRNVEEDVEADPVE